VDNDNKEMHPQIVAQYSSTSTGSGCSSHTHPGPCLHCDCGCGEECRGRVASTWIQIQGICVVSVLGLYSLSRI
jgi:hypothetical protein